MMSLLLESFIVFYLIEVMVLVIYAFYLYKESEQNDVSKKDIEEKKEKGPTPSDLIKMRSLAKQLDRQK